MTVRPTRIQQAVILAFVPLLHLLKFLPRRRPSWDPANNLDWHHHRPAGDIMRRRINGEWQHRAMTDEEHKRYMADPWG